MNKKILIASLVAMFIVTSTLSVAYADTSNYNNRNRGSSAYGAGTFLCTCEGEQHKHYFAFSVSEGNRGPNSAFSLICINDGKVCMVIKSDKILHFKVVRVAGGLSAVFDGTATVKMEDGLWEKNWKFAVTAFDAGYKGKDFISVQLTNPLGELHQVMEGVLTSGKIVVEK